VIIAVLLNFKYCTVLLLGVQYTVLYSVVYCIVLCTVLVLCGAVVPVLGYVSLCCKKVYHRIANIFILKAELYPGLSYYLVMNNL